MAATSRQNPYYYISQAAITINPNAVDGDPSYVAVSVVTGTLIMLSVKHYAQFVEGLDYTADQQNPTWRLSGYSTKLQDEYADKQVYIYARLVADASNGLLVFSDEDYTSTIAADGNSSDPGIAKKDNYIYVKLGYLTVPYSGKRDVNWDSGCLLTQYAEDTKDEFGELFKLVNNVIKPLKNFSDLTVNGLLTALNGLKVNGNWLFNNYEITDLKAYADYEKQLGTVISATDDFDKYLPSMKLIFSYINNHLRNDIDSIAKGKITFAGGINLDNQDITGVDVVSDVPDGGLTDAKDTSVPTTAAMVKHVQKHGDANYLSKVKDDTAKGVITFEKGLKVGNFTPGVTDGTGGAMEVSKEGVVTTTTDYLNVRRKARFNDVEILTTHHIGGAQMSSAASCKIDFVETVKNGDTVTGYRCYFRQNDADGRAITNDWVIGDQAYCNTFNLSEQADGTTGNHFFWRFVNYKGVNKSIVTGDDGAQYNGNEYHYIILSGPRCAEGSDAPQAGDKVVLLGHQPQSGETEADYAGRQSAIYQVASGTDGRPYYRQYVGINSFSLDGCLEQQFMPGDNIFSGKVIIKGGSGIKNMDDYNEVLEEIEAAIGDKVDVQFSNSNLLVNSGFYGDAKSLDIDLGTTMNVDTEMFSPSLLNWANNNAIVESNEDNTSIKDSLSGFVCVLDNGSIAQQLGTAVKDEPYVFSLRAIGSFSLSFAGYSETFEIIDSSARKIVKFKAESTTKTPILTISGTGAMCELMLERGTITSATWARSVLDVTPEASRLQNLQYLANAIREGSTDILGGLILSNIIMLGNYVNGKMKQVTSGISGTYNQDNDVSYWAGGTLEGAIQAVTKFIANPFYEPTPEEAASFAKAIITHGGKAILQDAIVRGNIYADNGIFRGEVNATSGTFVNGKFDNVVINGAYNRLVISITPQNSQEYIYSTNEINHALLLKWGDVVYLDEGYSGEITFPYLEPVYNDGTLSYTGELGWKIDNGQIVRMEESDVRSLVGRQIAIYGRKINGAGINIYCGMHKEVFASDTQTEGYTISNPYSENTALYKWENGPAKVASLGLTIATCILAQKHYKNINEAPSSAEMITWSIQYMPMMNGSVDTALAYFWYKIDGTEEQFEFKFYDGWTWAQFVKSQFNNGTFDIELDGKVIYVKGENESLDVYKYFGSGDSVYANDKIENGITYSNTYTE